MNDQELKNHKKANELNLEFEKFRHENKMNELKYMRENSRREHEQRLEWQRIKSAEIRKTQQNRFIERHK